LNVNISILEFYNQGYGASFLIYAHKNEHIN